MNLEWEQNWLEQFDNRLDELMANYGECFEYEDMNLGVRIVDDKNALRRLFETFENKDVNRSRHVFQATRYHGDAKEGTLEWTWEIQHVDDFLGLPTAGKTTMVRGITIHAFDADGRITKERSLWDTAALMRHAGLPAPAVLSF